MKIGILFFVLLVSACAGDSKNSETSNEKNLVVSVLNSGGVAVELNSISYASVDAPATAYELECDGDDGCSEWDFPDDLTGGINITARAWLENASDPLCMDFYSGEQYIDVNPEVEQRINVFIYYEVTACE